MSALDQLQKYGALEPDSRFAYVLRHPLGDDAELLKKLEMVPEDCTSCDLYWVHQDELIFVSMLADLSRKAGVSAHRKPNVDHGTSFFVVVAAHWLEHRHVEQALAFLSQWVSANPDQVSALSADPVVIDGF